MSLPAHDPKQHLVISLKGHVVHIYWLHPGLLLILRASTNHLPAAVDTKNTCVHWSTLTEWASEGGVSNISAVFRAIVPNGAAQTLTVLLQFYYRAFLSTPPLSLDSFDRWVPTRTGSVLSCLWMWTRGHLGHILFLCSHYFGMNVDTFSRRYCCIICACALVWLFSEPALNSQGAMWWRTLCFFFLTFSTSWWFFGLGVWSSTCFHVHQNHTARNDQSCS